MQAHFFGKRVASDLLPRAERIALALHDQSGGMAISNRERPLKVRPSTGDWSELPSCTILN
jgi:hypothetical protein